MRVYKRGNKWGVDYIIDGERIKKIISSSREEAEKALEDIRIKREEDRLRFEEESMREIEEDNISTLELVTCAICGIQKRNLHKHLHFTHKIKGEEYLVRYPEAKIMSDDVRKMAGNAMRGKKLTEAHKKAINRKGLKQSSEQIRKRVEKNTGKKRTPEQRQRMSEAGKKRKPITEEARHNLKKALAALWADPAYKEAHSKEFDNYKVPAYFVSELNHKVRSSYEEKMGIFLKNHNIIYAYEKPFKLIFSDGIAHTYYADYTLLDFNVIVECKGRLDERSIIKAQLFKEQYPEYKYIVIGHKASLKRFLEPNKHYDEIFDLETEIDKLIEYLKIDRGLRLIK